jgi:hypothetical protein
MDGDDDDLGSRDRYCGRMRLGLEYHRPLLSSRASLLPNIASSSLELSRPSDMPTSFLNEASASTRASFIAEKEEQIRSLKAAVATLSASRANLLAKKQEGRRSLKANVDEALRRKANRRSSSAKQVPMASSLPDMLTAKKLQSLASYREATTDDVPAMGGKMLSSSSSSSTAKSAPENLWTSGRAFKDLSRPWKEVSRYSPTSGVNEKSKDLNRGGNQVAEDRCLSTSSMLKSPFVPPQSELRDEAQTDTGEMNPFIRWSQGGDNDPTIPELFPRPSPYNSLDHALPPLLNTDKINSSNVLLHATIHNE